MDVICAIIEMTCATYTCVKIYKGSKSNFAYALMTFTYFYAFNTLLFAFNETFFLTEPPWGGDSLVVEFYPMCTAEFLYYMVSCTQP